jgi:type I restriction enzyme, R subunit
MPDRVIAFIKKTQPQVWSALEAIHKDKLPTQLIDTLCQVLDKRGMLKVLREGFKFYGKKVRVAYFEPGHNLNPDVLALYALNDLRLVRQLRYDPNNENELDLAIFLNGLPIATAELKNPLNGYKK